MSQKPRKRGAGKSKYLGVSSYRDRHGKLRWRYRRNGFTANLGTECGSDDFMRRYKAALEGRRDTGAVPATSQARRDSQSIPEGMHTLEELIVAWYKSAHYQGLGDSTKRDYRLIAEGLREQYGNQIVEQLDSPTVKRLMEKKANKPEAANKLLRIIRLIYDYARDVLGWVTVNPAREVKKYKPHNRDGFHTWEDNEIKAFNDRWPEGSAADLAMAIMLYTGAARADAVKLGPDNVENGRLRYRRQKMLTRGGGVIDIPIHPELDRRLARLTPVPKTFLQTEAGNERTPAGLGGKMREWCDKAGLPNCTAHGLRKACARRLAEAGATAHEIMAVTGHKTLAEAQRYTEKVQRAGLADKAMEKLQ